MRFESAARTHVGCRRKINEDSLLSRADLGVWAVADGMGGHDAGEVASAMVVESLATLRPGDLHDRVEQAKRILENVNLRLIAMGGSGPGRRTIGTTTVAVVADERAFACLWVGDSRVYRIRGGRIAQLTRDHSLVQDLVDSGEIPPEAAATHPNANVITRAVGVGTALGLDSVEGDIRSGDVFLLASDGLTRLVSDEELQHGLQQKDMEATADQFIETCLERGAPDNVSLVMLRVV
jgi:serine/threonine protein phosphatase Stp1